MMRDPLIYLHDIIDSIENIQEDTQGLTVSDNRMKRMLDFS